MPKEITDVKEFLKSVKDDKTQSQTKTTQFKKVLYVKHGKRITKFKLRGSRYLYTFKTADKEKAGKLLQSIPANISKVEIKSKKLAARRKQKK